MATRTQTRPEPHPTRSQRTPGRHTHRKDHLGVAYLAQPRRLQAAWSTPLSTLNLAARCAPRVCIGPVCPAPNTRRSRQLGESQQKPYAAVGVPAHPSQRAPNCGVENRSELCARDAASQAGSLAAESQAPQACRWQCTRRAVWGWPHSCAPHTAKRAAGCRTTGARSRCRASVLVPLRRPRRSSTPSKSTRRPSFSRRRQKQSSTCGRSASAAASCRHSCMKMCTSFKTRVAASQRRSSSALPAVEYQQTGCAVTGCRFVIWWQCRAQGSGRKLELPAHIRVSRCTSAVDEIARTCKLSAAPRAGSESIMLQQLFQVRFDIP